tara:strand:- start:1435 stop:1650 length:216 start_codon:yes stop_codon:yes gene_type:complete
MRFAREAVFSDDQPELLRNRSVIFFPPFTKKYFAIADKKFINRVFVRIDRDNKSIFWRMKICFPALKNLSC